MTDARRIYWDTCAFLALLNEEGRLKPASIIQKRYKAIADHPGVHNVRVLTTNPDNSSSLGILDPIGSKFEEAWITVQSDRKTQNLANRNGFTEAKLKRSRRKSRVGGGRRREASQNSNR